MLTVATFKEKQDDWKMLAKVVDPKKILSEETLFLYLIKNKLRPKTNDENIANIGYSIHEALKDENHPTNNISDIDFGLGRTVKLSDDLKFELCDGGQKKQVEKIFIIGKSGSGKSTWIAKYVERYEQMYPNNKVYMISRKSEDEAFSKCKNMKYINIEREDLVANPLTFLDFKNCFVIFDDATAWPKKIQANANRLRDEILQVGRSRDISFCSSSHQYNNYNETKILWLETSWVVISLASQIKQSKDALNIRMGYPKDVLDEIYKKIHSRFLCVFTEAPDMILSDHECHLV